MAGEHGEQVALTNARVADQYALEMMIEGGLA